MYGLPCCVIAAASPPVKFGTSARSRLGHADEDRAGEHRPHHDVGVLVDRLLRERLGDLRLRLRVAARVLDLAAEDAARGVDLLDRELHALVEIGARRRAAARQLDQPEHLDRPRLADGQSRVPEPPCLPISGAQTTASLPPPLFVDHSDSVLRPKVSHIPRRLSRSRSRGRCVRPAAPTASRSARWSRAARRATRGTPRRPARSACRCRRRAVQRPRRARGAGTVSGPCRRPGRRRGTSCAKTLAGTGGSSPRRLADVALTTMSNRCPAKSE